MGLNPVKGNMYDFCTHTWNTVKGECPHGCSYCYCKRFGKQKPVRFDAKELNIDLGSGNFIFVGSSCDMWADPIPEQWISKTLAHCRKYSENTYLFQSKNPNRIEDHLCSLPKKVICGTTIETNRRYDQMGNAPTTNSRMVEIDLLVRRGFQTIVTCEPIMDFDLDDMLKLIRYCHPQWVNIGADSKGHELPEPSADKVLSLIDGLRNAGIEVKTKPNLNRIVKA